jgi:hypothetical protein
MALGLVSLRVESAAYCRGGRGAVGLLSIVEDDHAEFVHFTLAFRPKATEAANSLRHSPVLGNA